MLSIENDYLKVLVSVGKFLFEEYLRNMLLNKLPDLINFDYHFIIRMRRELLQLYRNDFSSLRQENFSKLKIKD